MEKHTQNSGHCGGRFTRLILILSIVSCGSIYWYYLRGAKREVDKLRIEYCEALFNGDKIKIQSMVYNTSGTLINVSLPSDTPLIKSMTHYTRVGVFLNSAKITFSNEVLDYRLSLEKVNGEWRIVEPFLEVVMDE